MSEQARGPAKPVLSIRSSAGTSPHTQGQQLSVTAQALGPDLGCCDQWPAHKDPCGHSLTEEGKHREEN